MRFMPRLSRGQPPSCASVPSPAVGHRLRYGPEMRARLLAPLVLAATVAVSAGCDRAAEERAPAAAETPNARPSGDESTPPAAPEPPRDTVELYAERAGGIVQVRHGDAAFVLPVQRVELVGALLAGGACPDVQLHSADDVPERDIMGLAGALSAAGCDRLVLCDPDRGNCR